MLNALSRLLLALDRKRLFARALAPSLHLSVVDVHLPDLSSELDGFTVLHISDMHVGDGNWGPLYFQQIHRVLDEHRLDVIVNTGDFIFLEPDAGRVVSVVTGYLQHAIERGIQSIAIFGNHDYFGGPELVENLERSLNSIGIRVLENQTESARVGNAVLTFVNITDDAPNFHRGVECLLSAPRPRVALVHKPDLVNRLPWASADLVLAGHTHGGQITLPGLEKWIVRTFCGSRYVSGLQYISGMPVYINRGLGYTGLPLRFRAAPEATVFRLTR